MDRARSTNELWRRLLLTLDATLPSMEGDPSDSSSTTQRRAAETRKNHSEDRLADSYRENGARDPRNSEYHHPYIINTVHLQNPYKKLKRFDGYSSMSSGIGLPSSSNKLATGYRDYVLKTKKYEQDEIKDTSRCRRFSSCWRSSNFTNVAQQYCLNSSLHGLRYVGDTNLTICERVFWIISFTAALLTAGYYIWFVYQRWNTSPFIISLSPESVPLTDIPFPAVTICNMNNAKKTEADRILNSESLHEKLLLEDICNSENSTAHLLDDEATNWTSMFRFMINVSQPCQEMLYYCEWHGNQTDCEKIFNPTVTDEGICCNFNSVHRKDLFYNPLDWSDLNITYPFEGIAWNPEEGYSKDVPLEAIPWRPYGAGLFYGLTLVLDADIMEYYCSSTASVGFKMVLHNPVETPKLADFAFAITPGEETRVIVTPRISSATPSMLWIPQKKRKCFFTSERKLRYYKTYTQRNCVLECEANFTQEMCQCVQHYMPKSAKSTICGKKDDQCATTARRAMEMKLYDDGNTINQFNITHIPSCNCWPGCFELNYNIEMSQSKLMSTFNIHDRYIKKNQKYFVENMAVVHLFFVESQFTKFVKNELFGFTEFLSSIGGLLGLCMGFSFLSLMEIVYFSTLRLWCRVKKHNKTIKNVIQVHPSNQTENIIYPFSE